MGGAWFKMPGDKGAAVHLYGPRIKPCAICPWLSQYQCDWKTKTRTGAETCDLYLCATHATEVGTGKHLCPRHHAAWQRHPRHPRNLLRRWYVVLASDPTPAAENQAVDLADFLERRLARYAGAP